MRTNHPAPSSHLKPWQRRLSWSLIAALLNPAAVIPVSMYSSSATARDTDIYLNASYAGSTAEPAIMLILDTSDSMNVPEAWREYDPDTYDSHVEYLWNSPNYIGTVSTADSAGGLTTAGSSAATFVSGANSNTSANARTMRYDSGWWSRKGQDGGTLTGTALRDAALVYANGTETGDPGARKLYRHYAWSNSTDCGSACGWRGGGMFLYWVPLEGRSASDPTLENDSRLRSDSFNKLWGAASVNAYGNTNPSPNPVTRGGIMFGTAPTGGGDPFVDYRSNNRCTASVNELEPSTVYAPSATARNAGKMLDQRWVRWGKYLATDDSRANFGSNDLTVGFKGADTQTGGFYDGYLNAQRDANALGNCDTLPVRTKIDTGTVGAVDAGDSYAGWTNLAADYGGYNFFVNRVSSEYGGSTCSSSSASNTLLSNAMRIYFPNATTHPVGSNLGQSASYFKKYFPIPEYYDVAGTQNVTTGASSGTSITKTRTCTTAGRTGGHYDAQGTQFYYGGTCSQAADVGTCNDQTGSCSCNNSNATLCASVPDPAPCSANAPAGTQTFYTRDNVSCAWSGRQTAAKTYSGCAWSGRQTKVVEGVGTYYYGGTCKGTCTGALCETAVNGGENYCSKSTSGTITISGTTMTDYRTDSPTAGCSTNSGQNIFHSGTCQGTYKTASSPYTTTPPASFTAQTSGCTVTATTSTTINGVTYPNYSTSSSTAGCSVNSDNTTTCTTAFGQTCTNQCTSPTSPATVGATSGSTTTYNVFNRGTVGDSQYVFDCKADDGTANNPSSGYLRNSWTKPSAFGTANNLTAGSSNNYAYSTTASDAIPDASIPPINVYHPNYLNWKFGAKACRKADGTLITAAGDLASAATCRPIGRKTRLQIAKDALTDLVKNTNGVRFGLTVFNKMASSAGGYASEGGNIAYGIHRMGSGPTDSDYGNRAALAAKIDAIVATARTPLTETVYEAYRYFRGEAPVYGTLSTAAQGGGTVSDGRDTSAVSSGKYVSPMLSNPNLTDPAACQKNYIVLVTDGGPEDDFSANAAVSSLTQGPPYLSSTISTTQSTASGQFEISAGTPYGPTDIAQTSNYILLDELTYFMANGDMSPGGASAGDSLAGVQTVNTYTIGFAGGNTPILQNAAAKGGGQNYLAEDSSQLSQALADAIVAIRDWNPTVAAPTVPINALNRSESAEYAYLAFFAPKLQQRWDGTVKKYKISTNPAVCGTDLDAQPINYCLTGQTTFSGGTKNIDEYSIDPITSERTAKIRDAAVSIWSDTGNPDGGKPNAGGSCYVMKSTTGYTPATRKLYTHVSGTAVSDLTASANAVSESNALITKSILGNAAMGDPLRSSIINFARGGDPGDPNCVDSLSSTACTTWRTWPHGDVLHSQPAILTYKTLPDPDPLVDSNGDGDPTNDKTSLDYLFYMSNDGMLHAVDATTGQEQWTFMPEESFSQLKAIMDNAVGEHILAGDGVPVLYVEDVNHDNEITSADKAYLIFGMRRGGRAMYALDVSDKDAPKFMWKIDNTTSGFGELGETWSTPDLAKMRVSTDPVLVFGGGYDPKVNDMITVSLTRAAGVATVSSPIDHGYITGDSVQISGAEQGAYNGTKSITVTGPKTFTYTVTGTPQTPATGTVKVVSNQPATMGRGVYFVNAKTGGLIRSFSAGSSSGTNVQVSGMSYSIPSDALALNTDLDSIGYADRLYIGDMGGIIWRFDIDDALATNWSAIKFADLTGSDSPKRKLFFPPSVVKQDYLGQRFDAVYAGTGDRENPLRTDNSDRMFMVKDFEVGINSNQASVISFNTTDFYDLSDNLIQLGNTSQKEAATNSINNGKGWFMKLENGGVAGEKVVNQPTVYFNVLRFGTYSPLASVSACVPPGKGTEYAISAQDGSIVVDTNRDGVVTSADRRTTSNYNLRGFPSSGTIVIRDGKVWLHSVSDGVTKAEKIGTAGAAQRAYWFQEPER